MSLTNSIDEGVSVFVDHQVTCDDALPGVEDDRIKVTEIFDGVAGAHIECHPADDAMFVVDQI